VENEIHFILKFNWPQLLFLSRDLSLLVISIVLTYSKAIDVVNYLQFTFGCGSSFLAALWLVNLHSREWLSQRRITSTISQAVSHLYKGQTLLEPDWPFLDSWQIYVSYTLHFISTASQRQDSEKIVV